jgi:hypothetical protein
MLSVLFLTIMSGLLTRTYLFVPLHSMILLYLHVHIPPWMCVSTSYLYIYYYYY